MIQSDQAKTVLLITSDTYSKFINKRDYKIELVRNGSTGTPVTSKKMLSSGLETHQWEQTVQVVQNWFKNFGTKYVLSKKMKN